MSDWLKVADKLVNTREASDMKVNKSFFVAVTPEGSQLIADDLRRYIQDNGGM